MRYILLVKSGHLQPLVAAMVRGVMEIELDAVTLEIESWHRMMARGICGCLVIPYQRQTQVEVWAGREYGLGANKAVLLEANESVLCMRLYK